MTIENQNPERKSLLWIGRVLTTLIVLFMLMDGVMKIIKSRPAVEGTAQFGYPESLIRWIGLAALVSAILYAIPRTSILGAILLTGFLGGAIATHVRVSDLNWLFGLMFGVITWLGIYLRDPRLRSLVPLRQAP